MPSLHLAVLQIFDLDPNGLGVIRAMERIRSFLRKSPQIHFAADLEWMWTGSIDIFA